MNKLDVVRSVIIDDSQDDKSAFYADDFQSTNSAGEAPMDKRTWLALIPIMRASFPDIRYVVEEIKEAGDGVRVTGHFVGTFTTDLDLSAMGMGGIPASGKQITWPTDHNLVTVEGEQVTRWHNLDTGPTAGFAGFLKALGAG